MVFTEVQRRRMFQGPQRCWRLLPPSGHLVRVPAGAGSDTLQRVLQVLQTTC